MALGLATLNCNVPGFDMSGCGGSDPEVPGSDMSQSGALGQERLASFCRGIRAEAAELWRDLPWRHTSDPYLIWISEVMLQQTQVSRVQARWAHWLEVFPTIEALARASQADVLALWQGMGYNRRALALHQTASVLREQYDCVFPRSHAELVNLAGIGHTTAAGIRAFAFDEADIYLETNVRAVFIHEFFQTAAAVRDAELIPLIRATCPQSGMDVRGWYWALLDLGAHLKKTHANPARKAAAYVRQSAFEGSRRQKRAELVRILLAAREHSLELTAEQLNALLSTEEQASSRPSCDLGLTQSLLDDLAREGFCACNSQGLWALR